MIWLRCLRNVKLRGGVYAIEMSSLRFVWTKYESYILHAESLRLMWMKYESCIWGVDQLLKRILNTSAVMYTFQNLNTATNDKEWPDLDLGRSNWGRPCAIDRFWFSIDIFSLTLSDTIGHRLSINIFRYIDLGEPSLKFIYSTSVSNFRWNFYWEQIHFQGSKSVKVVLSDSFL